MYICKTQRFSIPSYTALIWLAMLTSLQAANPRIWNNYQAGNDEVRKLENERLFLTGELNATNREIQKNDEELKKARQVIAAEANKQGFKARILKQKIQRMETFGAELTVAREKLNQQLHQTTAELAALITRNGSRSAIDVNIELLPMVGKWSSPWGEIEFKPNGSGTYAHKASLLTGKFLKQGTVWEGTWQHTKGDQNSGHAYFRLGEDGNSIAGEYWHGPKKGAGRSWTASRVLGIADIQKMLQHLRQEKESQEGVEQLRTKQKIYTLQKELQKLQAAPENYLGLNISRICVNEFHDDSKNHCAHFVSHVKGIDVGYLCRQLTRKGTGGVSIRVHEIFAECPQVGKWNDKPNAIKECLAFVTDAANVDLANEKMTNVKKKHVGIFKNGFIYHYSNSLDKVVKHTPEQFKAVFQASYGGNVEMFFGAFPL